MIKKQKKATNYNEKELALLKKINDHLQKLDANLDEMEDTKSKVKHFVVPEEALHDIKSMIYDEKDVNKFSLKSNSKATSGSYDIVNKINSNIDTLEKENTKDDDKKLKVI